MESLGPKRTSYSTAYCRNVDPLYVSLTFIVMEPHRLPFSMFFQSLLFRHTAGFTSEYSLSVPSD